MLTFGELVGSVDVVGAHGDQGELEAASVRADHHLGGCFACRVWVRGREDARFAQVGGAHGHVAVHLVGGDVD